MALAYFYCDYKDTQKQSPTSIISTLLSTIASQNEQVFLRIQTFFEEQLKENPAYVPEFDELLSNFSHFVADSFREIFIIIDALDESEDRECVAYATKTISEHCSASRILVTSRNEVDIARTYEDLPNTTIEPEDVAGDIRMYVEAEVGAKIRARKLKLRDANLREVISEKLIQGAHGMFQWVKCQIDQLCRLRNDKAVRNALDDLPKTLHDTYFRILQKLEKENGDEVEIVHRLLRWLVRGVRNLTLSELAECVSIIPAEAEDSFDFDAVFTNPEDVIELCGSLVSQSGNGSVGLAHYTVKEFLVSESLKEAMPQFWVGNSEVHTELASVCLTYLCYDDFSEDQHGSGDVLLQKFEEYKLLPYAVQAWGTHALLSDFNEDVFNLTMRLFESSDSGSENYKLWSRIYQYLEKTVGRVLKTSICTPLYFASLFGLPSVVAALIESNGESDIKESMKAGATSGHGDVLQVFLEKCLPIEETILAQCLYVAASRGHDKVVKQLLDAGVDVNAQGGKNGTALQVAALEGRYEVASVLIGHKADMNITCKRYGVPLSAAAEKGHLRTLQILLDNGANVNGRGGWYSHPLTSAVVGKNLQIVEMLLSNGADVNALGGRHGCPLMAAAYMGMLDLIRLLVNRGARVNDENDKGSDALYAACMAGNIGAVRLLLDLGADINARGGKHRNALNAASAEGHLNIVRHLLEAGADVDFFDEHYGNSVQVAAFAGYKEIVRVLAEAGVDVNASGGDRGTALVAAAQNGHLEVVSLLFELGVPSGNTYEMDNAIMVAARRGHIKVVEALIDAGAVMDDIGTLSTYPRCTPLEAAAEKSNIEIIKLLLDRGADVNYFNEGRYSRPLMAAILSDKRSLDVVKLLVNSGATINTRALPDSNCACALAAAIHVKDFDIFTYLIEMGADPNLSESNYFPCLQIATWVDDERFMDILLDKGADVNLQIETSPESDSTTTSTALQAAAHFGTPERVRKLVERGAHFSIESEACYFKSALQAASFRGDTDIIKTLIELGDDVNVVGGVHGTALQAAALQGKMEAVQMLLDAGAEINRASVGRNGSALFAAIAEEHDDVVRLLIEKGADINLGLTRRYNFVYPIHSAASRAHENILQTLLDSGASVNAKGGKFCTALQAAAAENLPNICRTLLEHGADPNILGGIHGTALQAAYNEGAYEVIWLLFDHGASHTLYGGMHGTALGAAINGACQTLVVRLIRDFNADPNLQVRKWGSSLQACIARERGDDSLSHLIQENADVNARGGLYGNPLIAAVVMEDEDSLNILLDAGADVNIEGNRYYPSAAHAAIRVQNLSTLKRLVAHGARLDICNGIHGSTLEYAAYKGSLPIMRYLISRGVSVNTTSSSRYGTALQAAAMNGKHEIIKYLVKQGADVNAPGGKFGCPLSACILNAVTINSIELLLNRGANPNTKGGIYGYPLQAACASGDLDAVLLLLHYGANVNARGGKFHTALQASCVKAYPDITGLLIERGADVNAVGGSYRCALHAAAIEGWPYGCELLMRNGADWRLVDRKASHLSEGTLDSADDVLREALDRQENGWPDLSDSDDGESDAEEVEDDDSKWDTEDEDGSEGDTDEEEDSNSEDSDDDDEESEAEEKSILPWNVDSIPFFDAPYVYREPVAVHDDGADDSTSEHGTEDSRSSGKASSKTEDVFVAESSSKEVHVSVTVADEDHSKDWADLEWLELETDDIGPDH